MRVGAATGRVTSGLAVAVVAAVAVTDRVSVHA